jgi:hypothetical protein
MIYRDRRKYVPIEKGFRFVVIPGLTRNPVADFLDSRFLGNDMREQIIMSSYMESDGTSKEIINESAR